MQLGDLTMNAPRKPRLVGLTISRWRSVTSKKRSNSPASCSTSTLAAQARHWILASARSVIALQEGRSQPTTTAAISGLVVDDKDDAAGCRAIAAGV